MARPKGSKNCIKVDPERIRGLLRQCDEAKMTRDERYVMLRDAGLNHYRARLEAGYKTGKGELSKRQKTMLDTIEQQREELRAKPGLTLADSVDWYRKKSNGKKIATSDAIKARTRIDSLLGYDSPQRMEVNTRHDIRVAVGVLQQIAQTPQEVAAMLQDGHNG